MALTASRLLADLDRLTHPARTRVLVRVGLDGAGTPELDGLLEDLFRRGPWERRLSLRIATFAAHPAHVRRCLTAGETSLALRALGPAVRLGIGGDALAQLVVTMPAAARARLTTVLRRQGETGAADALLGPLRARFGDREAAALLPACSSEVVTRELGSLAHAVGSWSALARRHPVAFLDHVDAELVTTPRSAWRGFLGSVSPALAAVARLDADRVLAVLERAGRDVHLGGALRPALAGLARHDPARVLDLLLAPGRSESVPTLRKLWRALAVLDDDSLVRLGRALEGHDLPRFLRVLPPARRAAVYLPLVEGRDLVGSDVPLQVLDELPWRLRHAEAGRLLGLRVVADDPWLRLEVSARLPWAEAEPVLRSACAQPLAEDRGRAYPLLALAASSTRDPAVVETFLASLGRLLNEQDTVRAPALGAIARLPTGLVTDGAAAHVTAQVSSALQARDASHSTRAAARRIGDRLLLEGVLSSREALLAAGLRALEDTGGHVDRFSLSGLVARLPRGAEPSVYAALLPRIVADERVGRFAVPLALAEALGERAWPMEELQRHVGRACRARDDDVVRRAVELWLAAPATRDERVATVHAGDPSTITIRAVARAIATRRTDLLDAVFDGPQRGRFLARKARHVPAIVEYVDCWVPRQIARYRALLRGIVEDPQVRDWERASAVRRLGRVPGSVDDVRRHLDDPTPQLADAALEAIAWTDEPALVLPDLVARAGGDRAHVAFAALTRCARFVAPEDLGPALLEVLRTGKVTARKEVCRLIAGHRVPDAAGILAAQLAPAEHRDVRRAAASSLRDVLDDERAWTALAGAALDPEVATALLVVDPLLTAPRHRARYALLVGEVAASVDPDVALAALRSLAGWVRWDTSGGIVSRVSSIATDLDGATASAWRPAVAVLVAGTLLVGQPGPLLVVVDRLREVHAERDLTADLDAATGRDLPARQRLAHLGRLIGDVARDDSAAASTAALVSERVATSPLLLDLAVSLAVEAVPWERPDDAVAGLLRVVDLCGRPGPAAAAAVLVEHGLARALGRLGPEVPERLVGALVRDPRPEAAILVVALISAAGSRRWSAELRAHLRGLRRHPDADVRLAAVRVVTSEE